MLQGSTLVVVADGAVGRFFQRERPGAALVERLDLAMTAPEAEQERDRAPRVHDSFGGARHAIERRMTAHETSEMKFLADVADRIIAVVRDHKPACLVLCAPPRALGQLRRLSAASLHGRAVASLDKDITKETVDDIDARIRDLRA